MWYKCLRLWETIYNKLFTWPCRMDHPWKFLESWILTIHTLKLKLRPFEVLPYYVCIGKPRMCNAFHPHTLERTSMISWHFPGLPFLGIIPMGLEWIPSSPVSLSKNDSNAKVLRNNQMGPWLPGCMNTEFVDFETRFWSTSPDRL